MTITEAGSIDELVADCAALPRSLYAQPRTQDAHPHSGGLASLPRGWEINDTCLAQVTDLDEYV